MGEAVRAAAFRVHPYHHEIVGDMADLESMTRNDLYHHYRSYYVPNNAIIAVAGDFETAAMLERISELFAPIPAGSEPPRRFRPEPPQRGEHRLMVEGLDDTAFVEVLYRAPKAVDDDFFPFMVLDSLLAGPSGLNMFGGGISNKTSSLYKKLIEGDLAVGVSGGLPATIDPYGYHLTVTVHPERKPDEVILALDEEIERVQQEPPSVEAVARAVKQARALFAYGSESITNQGFWMGFSEMFASYEWFNAYLERLAAVTPDDVQRIAQTYLVPRNRVVGTYVPMNNTEVSA